MQQKKTATLAVAGVALALLGTVAAQRAFSSDHADTPGIAASPGTDLTDVFVFPSPSNPNNVVLAMCVSPLIPAGGASSRQFDNDVLYQFKIDNSGDGVEDLVIQAKFEGIGVNQQLTIAGPKAPEITGTQSTFRDPLATGGRVGTPFSPTSGMTVFAGPREDPFFLDLEQLFTIFPDRASSITGTVIANPNAPQATTWRAAGVAKDFLKDLNVLAIVVELPKSKLRGTVNGKIGVWCTTSK